ncbi:hypothetical protein GCM10010433_50400 [Streptomyces pulveraceus]
MPESIEINNTLDGGTQFGAVVQAGTVDAVHFHFPHYAPPAPWQVRPTSPLFSDRADDLAALLRWLREQPPVRTPEDRGTSPTWLPGSGSSPGMGRAGLVCHRRARPGPYAPGPTCAARGPSTGCRQPSAREADSSPGFRVPACTRLPKYHPRPTDRTGRA